MLASGSSHRRPRLTALVYTPLLLAAAAGAGLTGAPGVARRPIDCLVVAAVAVCAYFAEERLLDRDGVSFDAGDGVALVALVCGGPVAAALVWVIPDAIRLVRRGRAFWGPGLLANVVSYLTAALAGLGVLAIEPANGPDYVLAVVLAGAVMSAVNYVFARLLFAGLLERRAPLELLRSEFLRTLPIEVPLLLLGAACVLLVPPLGVLALLPLAAVVYAPQYAMALIVRANSVARLDVDRAARVYVDALGDELVLDPGARRAAQAAHALLDGRSVDADDVIRALTCALEADICERRAPVQPAYRPALTVQAVLVARAWAHLTARGTRALNHEEALCEMRATHLRTDAPDALAAAAAIAARERVLTHHTSPLPRLHRLWIPRSVRAGALPALLGRLSA